MLSLLTDLVAIVRKLVGRPAKLDKRVPPKALRPKPKGKA